MFGNPNLIPRIIRIQEGSVSPRPIFRSHSWPSEWFFVEDLPFDECFELSLIRARSKTTLDDTVLDPEFLVDIEVQRANRSIDDYIFNSSQTSIVTTNILEPSESSEATFFALNSSVLPSISKINFQLSTSPSTTPLNSSSSNVVVNPPRVMDARYAPLVLP